MVLSYLTNAFSLIQLLRKRSRILSIGLESARLEENLRSQGTEWRWKRGWKCYHLYPVLYVIMYLIQGAVNGSASGQFFDTLAITSYPPILIFLSTCIQFLDLASMVVSLQEHCLLLRDIGSQVKYQTVVKSLWESINDVYGPVKLIYCINTFVFVISTMYFELIKSARKTEISQFMWVATYSWPLVLTIMACSKVSEKELTKRETPVSLFGDGGGDHKAHPYRFCLAKDLSTVPCLRHISVRPVDFVVSRRRLVCSTCLVLSISVSCCTMQFYNNTHPRRVIKILFTAFVNVLSLAILVMRRAGVLSIYQTLRKIEQELLADGVLWDWVPISVRIYHSQIIFFSMFLFTVLARLNHDTGWTVSFICAYMFSFPLSLSVISQFTMLQAVFSSLFDQIVQLKDVTRALVVFSQLSSASDTLKSMYGLQTLLYTTATFIFIVCNLYYELAHPLNIRPIFDLTDIIHFVWILVIFYTFLDIIVSCNRTVSKARKVNEVLFERMVEDTTNSLINNELLEFHLTSYRELEFTACGYFTLDNSLICSMIACATTYLVILLQYIHPELAAGGSSNNTSY